jgi:regulator of sigma E protease
MLTTIITFVLILGLLVFVHELGHFAMAKKMGMKVEEFGFGFPPRLFGRRRGGTMYSVNWIPLGGFVRIKGESGEYRQDSDSFAAKKIWQRAIVLSAGVFMNIVLAGVLLSIGYMFGLPSAIDGSLPKSARVRDEQMQIMRVLPESPAAEAKLAAGDTLQSIDGLVFDTAEAARAYIKENGTKGVEIIIKKEDGTYLTATVAARELGEAGIVGIGVGLIKTGIVSYAPPMAVVQGFAGAGMLCYEVVRSFAEIIKNLIVRQEAGMELSGPVGIAVMTGQFAAMGLIYLLQFTAVLSVNLAVINILPFPALDGGRLLFLVIEKIRRRPIDEQIEGVVHAIGFFLLMLIVVLVTYQDFVRYGGQMWGAIKRMVGA